MKTAQLILTIVGFGALTLAGGLAGEPSTPSVGKTPAEHPATSDHPAASAPGSQTPGKMDRTDGQYSALKNDGDVPEKNGPAGAVDKTIPMHGLTHGPGQVYPKPVISSHEVAGEKRGGNLQTGGAPENHISRPQPELNPTASMAKAAAKRALSANQPGNLKVVPGKLPIGSGTTEALPGEVRSRNAGTANLGGPAVGGAKNSLAGINGREVNVKRKF
jgi:hypothetical protein